MAFTPAALLCELGKIAQQGHPTVQQETRNSRRHPHAALSSLMCNLLPMSGRCDQAFTVAETRDRGGKRGK